MTTFSWLLARDVFGRSGGVFNRGTPGGEVTNNK